MNYIILIIHIFVNNPCNAIYCHVPARQGLQQTARAATRHGGQGSFGPKIHPLSTCFVSLTFVTSYPTSKRWYTQHQDISETYLNFSQRLLLLVNELKVEWIIFFYRAGDESKIRNPYRWLPRKDDRDDKKDKKKGAERRTSSPSEVIHVHCFIYTFRNYNFCCALPIECSRP